MAKIKALCVKSYSINYKKSSGKSKVIEQINFVENQKYSFNKITQVDGEQQIVSYKYMTDDNIPISIIFEVDEFEKYFIENSKLKK